MSSTDYPAVPTVSFKNIVVNVTEDSDGTLHPHCVKTIACTTADTILNFQLGQAKKALRDYRFDQPELSGDKSQLGNITIGKSGKMMTVCNEVSQHGSIHITLKVYDHVTPSKRGAFDPEVANQPDGIDDHR